ncbi:hypothetical protein BC827DRAFT_1241824 [Russula dissimulans]|nr:hypothetical protein BC827DRAFT_1241824 [Russula dissimulans]
MSFSLGIVIHAFTITRVSPPSPQTTINRTTDCLHQTHTHPDTPMKWMNFRILLLHRTLPRCNPYPPLPEMRTHNVRCPRQRQRSSALQNPRL